MSEAGERRETDPSFENDSIKLKRRPLLLRKWSNGVLSLGLVAIGWTSGLKWTNRSFVSWKAEEQTADKWLSWRLV